MGNLQSLEVREKAGPKNDTQLARQEQWGLIASATDVVPQSLGLKKIYAPANSKADVIFVHGLTGHRERTWKSRDSPVFWLRDLLPAQIADARIFTFGYDANIVNWRSVVSQNRIGNHAKNLLHAVTHQRDTDGTPNNPLYFISHSLGGLVCEDALLSSRNSADVHLQTMFNATRGLIFLGTPHSGAALAKYAETFLKSLGVLKKTTKEILRVLTIESEVLARIQSDFHTMIRGTAQSGTSIAITCFYEELPISGIGMIVPSHSAILTAYPHIGIHANHMDMVRFSRSDDPGFQSIAGELQRWIQEQDPKTEATSTLKPLFHVPYDRHSNFVGCESILHEITERLESTKCVALAGIGGVGKSEIAIEYCYRYHETNPNATVFWIPADSMPTFEQAYMVIAKKLQLPQVNDHKADVMQLVVDYLNREENGPWLMVLDNADDLEMFTTSSSLTTRTPLTNYIPRSTSGRLIITTRDSHAGLALSRGKPALTVYPLNPNDASLLFLTSLVDEPKPDTNIIRQILSVLDCLPLAITQACAYINRNSITTTQYLALLSENDAGLRDLLSDDQYDLRRGFDSVIRTWKLSFDQIRRQYAIAAKVLSVMAFLDRQDIPRDLLRDLTGSQQQLTSALGTLQAFSLIRAERGAETYSMHRLVQFVTCVWQEMEGSKSQHQEEALNLVVAKFPVAENEDPLMCQSLLPHAYAVQDGVMRTSAIQVNLSDLQYNMSWFEDWCGHYQIAQDLCSIALETRKAVLGPGHLHTLHAFDLFGSILRKQGDYSKAALIHKENFKQKELTLGASHIDTVQSLCDLTDIYILQGDFKAAEDSARKVFTARSEIIGPEHLSTLSIKTTLAYIFMLRGNLDEAHELAENAVESYQTFLGREHEKTLRCTATLCQILREMGEYPEAITRSLEVVSVRREILGPEHPHTLTAINNLAMLRRKTGEFKISEQLYRETITILERTLGIEHPETMASSSNLAVVLRDQERFKEAEHWNRLILERRARVLGESNPRTLITLNELAILLDMMGKYDEAFEVATRGLQARLSALGEEHPDCATSLCTLASVLRHRGDLEPARELLERALGIRVRMLKETHPDTLGCGQLLEAVLEEQKVLAS